MKNATIALRAFRAGKRAPSQWASLVSSLVVGLAFCLIAGEALAALTLSASVNPQPARPGEMLDVEFTVTNTDATDRTGVVLTMVYPTGLNSIAPGNFGASCPPSFCDPGETVTWTLGTIPAGRAKTVDLPPFVAAATVNGTVIAFNGSVTDSTLQVANASASTQVNTSTQYDIALRDNADPVSPGAILTYQVLFGYREEALTLAASSLDFPIPAGTTFLAASGGGVLNGNTVQWNLGTLTPGEGGTRIVTVVVNANGGAVLSATAKVFTTGTPTVQATASALTVVDVSWPLSLTLDANPDPARPGEQLNVQMVVTNNSPVTRTNLSLRVRYPDGINSFATSNINGASCPPSFCDPGEQVTYAIASLGAGESLTLELPTTVAAATPDGTIVNFFAMLSDAVGGNATAIDSVLIRTLPHYDLAIRDSADPAVQLEFVTVKLTYGYREEAPAPAASTLRFRVPENVGFLSAADDGVFDGVNVTWDLGTLNPGDGGTRELIIQASGSDGSVLRSIAGVFNASKPIEEARAEGLTIVYGTPKIAVDLDANADPARPGELLNVQAVVTNRDAIARSITLRVRYPDGANSIANGNINGGTCPPSFCDPGEMVTYAIGTVQAHESMTVELPAFVAAAAADGQLLNFYAIANDTAGGNASSIDSVRVRTNPNYDLAIRESADPVMTGDLLTYKISFGYREDAPVSAASTLRARLPAGATYVSSTGGGNNVGSLVDWSLGTLSPGDGGFRELTVQVASPSPDVLEVAARVFSNTNPVEQAAAEALTTVDATPVISLQIAANADPARNEMLNVQFVVTNRDVVNHNVTLRARYPGGVSAIANSNIGWSPPGSCPPSFCDTGEMVTFSLGEMMAGQSTTVEIMPSVPTSTADGRLLNFFAIATDTTSNATSSSDQVHVNLLSRYDLAIRDSADAVLPGAMLTYKLTYGYRADAPVIGDSRLRFRLPAGTAFQSATGGGVLQASGHVFWDLGQMSPGDGGVRTVTVQVNAPDTSVLQAQAEIFDVARAFKQAVAEELTVVDADPKLSLSVTASPNPTQPNQQQNLQMVITNLDSISRTVSLRLRYPDGLFSLNVANMTPTGTCPPSFCDPTEMITWNLGALGAGQSTTVTVLPTTFNTAVNGQLINFFAIATDTEGGIATGIDTVRVGVCSNADSDCDGVLDTADNCILEDNADQRDTDGDGIGNVCDADLNQNCLINFSDLAILKARFTTADPDADFDGSGTVTFGDLAIMKQLFLGPPGPSGVPNLCSP